MASLFLLTHCYSLRLRNHSKYRRLLSNFTLWFNLDLVIFLALLIHYSNLSSNKEYNIMESDIPYDLPETSLLQSQNLRPEDIRNIRSPEIQHLVIKDSLSHNWPEVYSGLPTWLRSLTIINGCTDRPSCGDCGHVVKKCSRLRPEIVWENRDAKDR